MTKAEYKIRDRAAYLRLKEIGEHKNAECWLKSGVPKNWTGTPFEYAELEMPVGWLGRLLNKIFGG